jgi:hypothetical protein
MRHGTGVLPDKAGMSAATRLLNLLGIDVAIPQETLETGEGGTKRFVIREPIRTQGVLLGGIALVPVSFF